MPGQLLCDDRDGRDGWHREVVLHAHVTAGLFWLGFLAGTVTTDLLSGLALAYVVVVVVAKSEAIDASPDRGNTVGTLSSSLVRWAVLFPAAVLAINASALWLFGRILETPSLRTPPLVQRLLAPWTAWDATGLVILVLATSGLSFLTAFASATVRAVIGAGS